MVKITGAFTKAWTARRPPPPLDVIYPTWQDDLDMKSMAPWLTTVSKDRARKWVEPAKLPREAIEDMSMCFTCLPTYVVAHYFGNIMDYVINRWDEIDELFLRGCHYYLGSLDSETVARLFSPKEVALIRRWMVACLYLAGAPELYSPEVVAKWLEIEGTIP